MEIVKNKPLDESEQPEQREKLKGGPNEREILPKIEKRFVLQRTECEQLIVNPKKRRKQRVFVNVTSH